MCLDDQAPNDPRYMHANEWHTGMMDAPCKNPLCCLGGFICPIIGNCYVRRQTLEGDMSRYRCCQGYYDMCCWRAGMVGEESCPDVCNVIESCLCATCSISATRMLVMDTRDIKPDPCDTNLIAISNCLQMISCLCNILAMIDDSFDAIADLIDFIADLFLALIMSCMIAQVNLEMKSAPRPVNWGKMNAYPRSGSKQMRMYTQQQGGGVPGQMQMGGGGYGGGGGGYGGPPGGGYGGGPGGGGYGGGPGGGGYGGGPPYR